MPDDALRRLRGPRSDPGAGGGRALVRAPPGGGTRLTPPRRAALAFGATLLLTALALATFPETTARATRVAGFSLAVFGLALGWSRPVLATCLLAAAVPLGSGLPRLLGDHAGALVLPPFALAVLGGALARRLARREASLLPRPLVTWASAFLALAAGSAAASAVRGETLWLLFHGRVGPRFVNGLGMTAASRTRDALLTFLGLVLLLAALDAFARLSLEPDGRDWLLLSVSGGGAAALVVSVLERFRPLDPAFRPWADLNRRAGTFTDPNALGVGIGLLVPLLAASLVARGTSSDRARRIFAILGLVAAPVALEASGSRTGLLLLAFAGLAAAVGLLRRRHVPLLPVVAAAAAAVFAGVLLVRLLPQDGGIASGGLLARLGAGLSSRSLAEFANHRFMFWRAAFEMTADEPLTGVGLAGFPYEFPVAWAKRHGEIHVTDGATNALLDVLSECGLPGFVLALLAVVPLLVRALEAAFARGPTDPATRAAGAALAGLFVACQTGSHLRFFEIGLLASLAAGLLLAPVRSSRDGRLIAEPGVGPGRTAAILAGAGILGAAVAVLPTRKPEAAFSANPWVGVYPALAADPYHWAGPLCYRGIRPGERMIAFRIQNARPDGDPVTVRLDVDGRGETALEVPGGGETRDVAVPVPEGGRVLRLRTTPSFVPDELDGKGDRRRLAVRLTGDAL